jgi:predicted transglutaminase-like cysteine proteinase
MEVRGYAFPPPAFKTFCAKEPLLCSTTGKTKAIDLTPERLEELKAVNKAANNQVKERSDAEVAGRHDDWRVADGVGDCEDFAILKKQMLMARGWPASALLLTVAWSGWEGHTVLTVRTSKGDLILDNRTSAIRDWSRTPYRYFARQSQNDHGTWTRIRSAKPI